MSGSEIYEKFMALHTRDGGLVMPNAWDGLSALMLADAGFEAIATSSAALAATLGRSDGRHEVTRDEKVSTVAELQKAGVRRISLGPFLYTHAMGALEQATKALVAGDLASATTGISFERISELLDRGKN